MNLQSEPTFSPDDRVFTDKEAAKYLKLTRQTLWVLRRRRVDPLPYLKIGGKVLYNRSEIDKWLLRQQRITMASRPKKTRTA